MQKLQLIVIAATIGVLTSCSSIRLVSIEQLQPAQTTFPDQVRRVAVVNNMPDDERNSGSYLRSRTKDFEGDGKTFSQRLADALAEGRYFDKVVICDSILYEDNDSLPQKFHPLQPGQVNQLTNDLEVDMVIAVDRLFIRNADARIYNDDVGLLIDAVSSKYTSLLHLYVPGREKALMSLSHADTLHFQLTVELTNREIAEKTADYAGTKEAAYLIPFWKEVQRFYYDGGISDFRDAGVALRENNWEEAHRLWSKVYDTRKGKSKMRSAYNIALYYELKDDLDQAMEWIDKAEALAKGTNASDKQLIAYYQASLTQRKADISKLNIQMQRFDEQKE